MSYRSLGRCGTKVSVLGLGGWTTFGDSVTDPSLIRSILTAAFDAGVNFFDTADVYAKGGAERAMGKVLAEFPRHELVLSSKVFYPMSDNVNDRGLSRKHIFESIDRSLRRLGTDYLDLYFCHRFDSDTPVEETARAMDDLVHRGKILYWGTSEWSGEHLRKALNFCESNSLYRPRVEQPQYSLLARQKLERDIRPEALRQGLGLVTWSPLAFGLLTGKYDDGLPAGSRLARLEWLREGAYTEDRLEAIRRLRAVADRLGCTRAQLALAWVAAQPSVSSVILGVTAPQQLRENLGALRVEIDTATRTLLDQMFPPSGILRS